MSELVNHLTEWSTKSTLVTICGKGGGRSAAAAEILKSSGLLNTFYLCGGTFGWYENVIKVD
ncbi:MAG: rhodanese-like domain-containing protein [Saprospiraceae bacterium]|nr:rhodanese-like domain-containing protein [Candidatus Vicinibacter affinis]